MSKDQIRRIIKRYVPQPALVETALKGVQFFHVTEPVPCMPVSSMILQSSLFSVAPRRLFWMDATTSMTAANIYYVQ